MRQGLLAVRRKRRTELEWWAQQRRAEGQLHSAHYERLFTEPFGLARAFFSGKSILDIGCGPRGTLEWADDAAERVGLDPLARRYRALGTDRHAMRYVSARAESIPFPDRSFDVVSCFNALDHVEDGRRAAAEMARVVAGGGILLLIVEVGHAPRVAEPLTLDWNVTQLFAPTLQSQWERRLPKTMPGVHDTVLAGPEPLDAVPAASSEPGVLVARLDRPSR